MHGIEITPEAVEESPSARPAGLLWTHAVWAIGTLALCGVWSATSWRMIEVQNRQHQAQLSLSRDFHTHLIAELHSLVGGSAASVTEDLCRVRFRLRLQEGSPPAGAYTVCLRMQESPLGDAAYRLIYADANRNSNLIGTEKIADFGLLPPGDYQLTLEDSLGMRCVYAFEVQPGVPVDRVACCPKYQDWMHQTGPVTFGINFDWPTMWESQPIVAVVHLRSGASSVGDWHWLPPERQQFDACVLVANGEVPASWESIRETLPSSLAAGTLVVPTADLPQGQQGIVVPYGCCEVAGVSFVLARDAEAGGCAHLGTCLYHSPQRLPLSADPQVLCDTMCHGMMGDIVEVSTTCPRQVTTLEGSTVLEVRLPRMIVPAIWHRALQQLPGEA